MPPQQQSVVGRRPRRNGRGLLEGTVVDADDFDYRCRMHELILASSNNTTRLSSFGEPPLQHNTQTPTHCVVCAALGFDAVEVHECQRLCAEHVMTCTKYYDRIIESLESYEYPTFRDAITGGPGYPGGSDGEAAECAEAWKKLVLESLKHIPRGADGERRRVVAIQDISTGQTWVETVNLIVLDDPELVVRYDKKRIRSNLHRARIMSSDELNDAIHVARTHRRIAFG